MLRVLAVPHWPVRTFFVYFGRPRNGLKGQRDPSPGQRRRNATPAPWVNMANPMRPERAKDLC